MDRDTTNGETQRTPDDDQSREREERRAEMQESEGHSGSIPRGNQPAEEDDVSRREEESDRTLGH